MALSDLLARFRPNRPDPEDVQRVKEWVCEILLLAEGDEVTVSEITCNDPSCPGLETVILVMRTGRKTQAFRSRGSIVVQTRPLVEKALLALPD